MKRITIWSCLMAAMLAMASPAPADQAATSTSPGPVCRTANDDTSGYPARAGAALGQGASNVLLGWTEIIVEPVRTRKAHGNLAIGCLRGIGLAVKRTVLGAVEVISFWSPRSNGRYPHINSDCPLCSPQP